MFYRQREPSVGDQPTRIAAMACVSIAPRLVKFCPRAEGRGSVAPIRRKAARAFLALKLAQSFACALIFHISSRAQFRARGVAPSLGWLTPYPLLTRRGSIEMLSLIHI